MFEDPLWWRDTVNGLRNIFKQDPFFQEKLFEKQMAVMKGQGWNIVQALQSPSEGKHRSSETEYLAADP
jgi:phosphatidylinositol 4-kinase type 2